MINSLACSLPPLLPMAEPVVPGEKLKTGLKTQLQQRWEGLVIPKV